MELTRFEKAHLIKNEINNIDRNLSLISKNGWGTKIDYNVKFTLDMFHQHYYAVNNSLTHEMNVNALKAYLNSLKHDLQIEFKNL